MDLEKCKALVQVIDTKSLSRAAKKLGYTPSGLSRMISSLEKEMGFTLLRRNHDGMFPTNECQHLLSGIRELLYQNQLVEQIVYDINELYIGEIEIGVSHRYYYDTFALAMKNFSKVYPDVDLQIRHGYSSYLVQELKQHRLDLCIVSKRELGDCQWIPITKDEMLAWIPKKHKLANEEKISVKEFEKENVIFTHPGEDTDNQRIFKKYKINPRHRFSTLEPYASFAMVKQGLGISMDNRLSAWGMEEGILYKSLDPQEYVEIGIALQSHPSPAVQEFMKYLLPLFKKEENLFK